MMRDARFKTETDPERVTQKTARKPWRTPQVIVSDVALTNTDGNGGTDGGTMGSPS